MSTRSILLFAALVAFGALFLAGCPVDKSEALDPSTLPEGVRGDYAVFAQRCSKCHSLQRPLASGITDDEQWQHYVARMRRQPGSGITVADEEPILRFLHYWGQQELSKKTPKVDPAPTPRDGGGE